MAVRTGDTAAAERAAMLRRPPDFLITTPESLYLLVTAERTRAMLAPASTVIVDEIHAVAGNKRGSHLALTLERLEHLAAQPVQRIGLSATQRPIETVARLLVGAGPGRSAPDGSPRCAIVDAGHRRELDLALELPDDELGAVASAEQMAEILDMIAGHVVDHRTTLVFVNTRRMAERVAHQLGERLGEDQVAAHHGSLSKDRRQRVESRLRSGDLRALVATASLELGIDIGPVELVCQIGSPRSFATFLQRVGRSNHTRGGIPAGRLYPTSRDELVECAALLRGARAGRLDALQVPDCPLDILAQQMVAECAAADWAEDDLLALARRAAPFAELSAEDFGDVAELVSDGIRTGRGRRAAYLHRDRVAGRLRGRRGARIAALTSGGAIPELGDFRVLAEPDETLVGTVNEDWAIESMAGRRVPARHDLVADPPGRAGHRPGRRCPRRAAVRPVLARRGPGPHDRAVGGGLRDPEGGGAAAGIRSPPGPGRPTRPPGCRPNAGSATTPRTRSWPTWAPGWPSSGCCPTWTPSCWNGSSTKPAACSWSGTPRSGPGSTGRSAWRCASGSASRSTSSCRPRPATMRSCCRSGRSTASRWTRSRSSWPPGRWRTWSGRRCSPPRCSRPGGGGT